MTLTFIRQRCHSWLPKHVRPFYSECMTGPKYVPGGTRMARHEYGASWRVREQVRLSLFRRTFTDLWLADGSVSAPYTGLPVVRSLHAPRSPKCLLTHPGSRSALRRIQACRTQPYVVVYPLCKESSPRPHVPVIRSQTSLRC